MHSQNILSKTTKGLAEATGKTTQLSRPLRKLLKGIDGRTPIAGLAEKSRIPEAELLKTLGELEQQGFVRKLPHAGAAAPAAAGEAAEEGVSCGDGEDLDFTAVAGEPAADAEDYFAARRAAIARAKAEETAKARAEGEAAARAQAQAEAAAKAKADAEAAAEAEAKRAQAAALVRAHHEARTKQAAQAKAKAEAEAAELRRKLEEERQAREELERKAKEDAERAVREAEERVRREAEERARREAEELRAKLDAERAAREAEARARREAEERVRIEGEERAHRDATELRATRHPREGGGPERNSIASIPAPDDTTSRAPPGAGMTNVSLAADEAQVKQTPDERDREVARRFEEEQAKREAERQAQQEAAERKRAAAEAELRERARAAEAAKQERLREEEERRRAAEEAQRRRQEEKARAHAIAVEQARAAASAAMLARQRADEEEALANSSRRLEISAALRQAEMAAGSPPRARRVGRVAAALFLLVVGAFAAAYFIPLDTASFERAATARFGTPVKIGSAHVSLLPMPALRFERVAIGPSGEIKIAKVASPMRVGAIFDRQNALKTLELDDLQIPASWLGIAIWGKGRENAAPVEHVIARGVRVEAPGLELPALTVDAKLDSGGALQSLSAQTADRKQTFNLTTSDGKRMLEISARSFQLPFPGAVPLGDLVGSGTLTPADLALETFELAAFGGSVTGHARVRWGESWSVEGVFTAGSMNARLASASLVPTGRLEGKGTFSMRAPTPHTLHEAARVDATFTIKNGTLGFADLTRALQPGNARGGTTPFASLDGNASFAGGTVRLAQLRLAAGLLTAAGDASVDPGQNLAGRLHVDVASRVRGVLALGGTVTEPHVKAVSARH